MQNVGSICYYEKTNGNNVPTSKYKKNVSLAEPFYISTSPLHRYSPKISTITVYNQIMTSHEVINQLNNKIYVKKILLRKML